MTDPEAAMMRVLYDEHSQALWRYALRLTGDSARAEDIVQETLLRAWSHPDVTADTDRSARAWLFTVARNLIIDEQRSARRRHETTAPDTDIIADKPTPDQVDNTLDKMLLGAALQQLSADHRAVVERAYYRGLSVAAIATELDIAEGTVKSRLHYAVRSLRLNLQEMGVTR